MAGNLVDDSSGVYIPEMDLTVVLVGPTGHGKSATGNTILGREAFISRARSSRVTETCELQTTVLEDGQTISVNDTPGLIDTEPELPGEEFQKCINLARNGIHAILFVVSGKKWFFKEDQTVAIRNLQRTFGKNIFNYMIVVFTGGNEVEIDFANHDILHCCEGRYVHLNNKTRDKEKRSKQVQNLLSQVKTVISQNGGKPFMSQELELDIQVESTVRDATTRLEKLLETHETTMNAEEISKLIQQLNKSNQEQTTQRIDAVEARLRDATIRLEQQMEAATLKADERAEMYLKEETSEFIQRISKPYEEQMTQRFEAVEQRVLDMAKRLEQQQAEARAAQMKVNEIAQQQMTHRINEEVESRVKDVTTRLEQRLAEAEAARLKADERAQEAQKNSDEHIQKLKEVLERAQEAQKNSDEHIQKLKEVLERAESSRSETIPDFGSSSFHVYDPSTYLLQSTIK